MSWYYAENGKQIGPVGDDEWSSLTTSGTITPETLVWKDGMAGWQPWSTVSGVVSPLPMGVVNCSFCNKPFPPDEVIVMDGRTVCASCKPLAVQLVKEGVSLPGTMNYAGFWIRFGAKFIDGIIVGIVNAILGGIVGVLVGMLFRGNTAQTAAAVLGVIIGMVMQAAYIIFFLGKMGATPGKMACGLKVVRPDGSPLTYGRATGRYFAELLNAFTLTIGYLIAAFDDEKRALHDRIADTRVVKK